MSCTVIVAHNPLDRDSWQRHENVPDLGDFILKDFAPFYNGAWPVSAKIYLEAIDGQHDITPVTPAMADALHSVEGQVYIMVWPGDAVATPILVNFALFVGIHIIRGATGDDRLRAGGPRKGTNRKVPVGSPNNVAGPRQNSARVEERIPDVYGRVRCTPDLIQVPYVTYVNNLQQEISYMCLGRGDFDIQTANVREGDTRVDQLTDTSVQIYPSGQIPGVGIPQLTIGNPITDPILTVIPIESAKGDLLQSINTQALYGDDLMTWHVNGSKNVSGDKMTIPATGPGVRPARFFYVSTGVGRITLPITATPGGQQIDLGGNLLQDRFTVGTKFGMDWASECVTIHPTQLVTGAGGPGTVPNLRLMPDTPDDIHYEVTAVNVTFDDVILDIVVPSSVQTEWDKLIIYNSAGGVVGGFFPPLSPGEVFNTGFIMYPLTHRLGPYFVDDPDMEFIKLNFVADRGLWTDDGKNQYAQSREIIVEITPASALGTASGPKDVFSIDNGNGLVISGSSTSRDFIGMTVNYFPSFEGRFLISVYNNTNTLNRHPSHSWETYNRQFLLGGGFLKPWDGVEDSKQFKGEVQDEIRWTHGYSMSEVPNTSFGGVTTVHAKVVQRKNQRPSEADRKLNIVAQRKLAAWNGTGFNAPAANQTGRDALFAVLKDPDIGFLPDNQIDFAGIASAFDQVNAAFADARSTVFDHTFDSDNASLEDMVAAIGDSCFVQVYREGDVIRATADVSTQNSTLLFNHRNKIPGTETRSQSFGTDENYDGVKVEYFDDTDDRIKSFVIPTEGATKIPKRVNPAGIRSKAKAAMHAWRSYNELLYKKVYLEFDCCEEAALSMVNDRILVADNTRPETQDGEIVRVDGTTLYLSQTAVSPAGSNIFIQHTDGTTESIGVALQDTPNSIVLANAPSLPLFVDEDEGKFPTYVIVRPDSTASKAFRVLDKSYKSPGVYSITSYNYAEGYYFNDGLRFWLAFKTITGNPSIGAFSDRGPYELRTTLQSGPLITVTDDIRGSVYEGQDQGDHIDIGNSLSNSINPIAFTSYTISFWINKPSSVHDCFIFSSAETNSLQVHVTGGSTYSIEAIHNGTVYLDIQLGLNEWFFVAITYDSVTDEMAIYLDGEQADTASSVPGFSAITSLRAFGNIAFVDGYVGRADDLRLYSLAKSPDFIRELYQRTRK